MRSPLPPASSVPSHTPEKGDFAGAAATGGGGGAGFAGDGAGAEDPLQAVNAIVRIALRSCMRRSVVDQTRRVRSDVRKSKYTREVLAPIVATSSSVTDVIRKLGLEPTGGNWRYMRARLRYLELDTSHFQGAIARRIAELTPGDLAALVATHTSVAQVAAALALPMDGGAHRNLKARIEQIALDTNHFRGRGWSRGETRASHPSVEQHSRKRMLPDSEVFIENAAPLNGTAITKRLLREGVPYVCASCGINEWRGKRLTLHLDHINGINNDNRRENLRLLCPNCHSQTDTYGRQPSRVSEMSHVLYEDSRERGATGTRARFRS